jgi:prophage regulatory protein
VRAFARTKPLNTEKMETEKLLRLPAVMERVGLRKTAIYEQIEEGHFPKPVPLGSVNAWPASEISAWIEKRKAEREANLAQRRKARAASRPELAAA